MWNISRRYFAGATIANHPFSNPKNNSINVQLNYSKIVEGKKIGRYIGLEDKGDLADEHI